MRREVCAALVVAAFFSLTSVAMAEPIFGLPGAGAGKTSNPSAVAVDTSDGNVYVADPGNERVDIFDAAGNFLSAFGWGVSDGSSELQNCTAVCGKGIAGSGSGEFEMGSLTRIAVDNDPASPAVHDIYVYDSGNNRVQRFSPAGAFILTFGASVNETTSGNVCTATSGNTCGAGTAGNGSDQLFVGSSIAVGPGGVVYALGDVEHLQRFESTGTFISRSTLGPGSLGENVTGLAIDSTGNVYAAGGNSTGAVRKYNSGNTLIDTFNPSFNIVALGLDDSGSLFISDTQPGYSNPGFSPKAIFEYDAADNLTRVLYGDVARRFISIAPYVSGSGDVFAVDEQKGIVHVPLPPPGPVVAPITNVSALGNRAATLNSGINPENEATTYHFEYVDQATFEAEGFANPTKTADSGLGADFALHSVSQAVTGLLPETTYHFRVVAGNGDGTATGPEVTFTTLPPFEVLATWSTGVASDSATLHAEVNPLGIPASGHFEYVDDARFQASGFAEASSVPSEALGEAPLDFGSGEAAQRRTALVTGLSPSTTYHYRVVASDSFATEPGPTLTFVTKGPQEAQSQSCPNSGFRTGASARLPDCRAYEMVSPVQKGNGDLVSPDTGTGHVRIDQVTPEGSTLTYTSYRPFCGAVSSPWASQYMARRVEGSGWGCEALSPPRGGPSFYNSATTEESQFKVFSEDLCSAWLLQDVEVPLAPGAIAGYPNLYRRDNCGGGYEALSTSEPFFLQPSPEKFQFMPQGFSADKSVTVFQADARLSSNASNAQLTSPKRPIQQLYSSTPGGEPVLVSVLSSGLAAAADSTAGTAAGLVREGDYRRTSLQNAVSNDGSRVYWSTRNPASPPAADNAAIFLRENPEGPQSPGGECASALPGEACTAPVSGTVSPNASKFWAASGDGATAIFSSVEDVEEPFREALYEYDADTGASQLIAGEVTGVMGVSQDAKRVYLVSEEEEDGEGEAGKPNLYLYDSEGGGGFTFIGTLARADITPFKLGPAGIEPYTRTSRVSADGLHAAFMSMASLTGYDNTDAVSGEADAEVFLYDSAAEGGAGKLVCVSCNPTGERPIGREIEGNSAVHLFAAAQIPGWPYQLYPSRLLSGNGKRLFFESFEPLAVGDINGTQDVYEWEAPGESDCTTALPSYTVARGGCVRLISSGQSPTDSEFLDASSDGSDIFFTTGASLVPQDPGLIDIYDARIDGGFGQPQSVAGCEGEACQGQPFPPNDPTPSSAQTQGEGNVPAVKCAKGKVRKGDRCVEKKKHKAKKKHKKQAKHRAGNKGGVAK